MVLLSVRESSLLRCWTRVAVTVGGNAWSFIVHRGICLVRYMIDLLELNGEVVLSVSGVYPFISYIDQKLREAGRYHFSKVFTVRREDLITDFDEADARADQADIYSERFEDEDSTVREFRIGRVECGYRRIYASVLGLNADLLISTSIPLGKRLFVAERNISVFRKIENVANRQIVLGGSREDCIPEQDFCELLQRFPTTKECNLYADARVARVLQEFYSAAGDAEKKLGAYLARRSKLRSSSKRLAPTDVEELEIGKFTYVRNRLSEMLEDPDAYLEREWQSEVARLFCLVFPKYIAALESVVIRERFSREGRATRREIDMVLVDSAGMVDILEIKKPFESCLMSRSLYRDNHVPKRELSGSIMQCEKYLYYLSQGGEVTERAVQCRLDEELQSGPKVRIVNPQAYILAGRDERMSDDGRFDFEFTRRAHKGIVDIITYDDLLRRLDVIIESCMTRVERAKGMTGSKVQR